MIAALLLSLASALASTDVAVLLSDDLPAYHAPVQTFGDALGRPYHVYDLRGDETRAMTVTERMKRDPPPLIFALGAKAAWVAARQLPDVPLVYAMVQSPDRYGIEGAHVTGIAMNLPMDTVISQIEVILPDVRSIGLLTSPGQAATLVPAAQEAAEKAGIQVTPEVVGDARELRHALTRLRSKVDALWLAPDPDLLTPPNFRLIRDAAVRARQPLLTGSETLVRAGALMCVTPDSIEVGIEAAHLATALLSDEGEVPVPVQPEHPRVVLNLDTLEALGLKLDPVQRDFVDAVVQHVDRR